MPRTTSRFTTLTSALAVAAPLLSIAPAHAEDFFLGQSAVHKLKVFAQGGAKWCGPHLSLRMELDPGSPDIANAAGQTDMMNRLRTPIASSCAAAVDAVVAVLAGSRSLGTYTATRDADWDFHAVATTAVSLDSAPVAGGAAAGDVPGAHDPDFLKRFEGSKIVSYQTRNFDRYKVWGAVAGGDKTDWQAVEGQITRLMYKVPHGHTPLELVRNYQAALTEAGFAQLGLMDGPAWTNGVVETGVIGQSWQPTIQNWDWLAKRMGPAAYYSARATRDGDEITVGVNIWRYANGWSGQLRENAATTFAPDEVCVVVDVVRRKAPEIHMVTVKAADMAATLAEQGNVDIYGIQFDVDKTDISPDSAATLEEIANLLKIDRSLRLEISGHTDSTGSAEHNLTLSEGRARAVVDALTQKYGIDPSRLAAKGYGDTQPVADNSTEPGRAKNRRVELKRI